MIIVVMGVAGSGKTTVGLRLAQRQGWPFYDGDNFHSPANVDKMRHGIPLTDADRESWLAALVALIRGELAQNRSAVVACSALKQAYRDRLCVDREAVRFVYLKGSYDLISARMQHRAGHYMQPDMLASQFAALEEPGEALTIEIDQPPEQMVDQIIRELGLPPAA